MILPEGGPRRLGGLERSEAAGLSALRGRSLPAGWALASVGRWGSVGSRGLAQSWSQEPGHGRCGAHRGQCSVVTI